MIKAKSRGFLFDSVEESTPEYSAFDLSFENKLSSNMGDLVVTLCKEVLPGDTVELKSSSLIRFAPTLAPILHKVDVMTYTFFVPNRLLWANWEKFITSGNGNVPMAQQASFVPPVPPYVTPSDFRAAYGDKAPSGSPYFQPAIQGTLADYLGIPNMVHDYTVNEKRLSLLPFLAYQLVWSEYFRDQNLEENPFENGTLFKNDGHLAGATANSDTYNALLKLRKKAWEKDMFTSALPTAQRGPSVILPLGSSASLVNADDVTTLGFVHTNPVFMTETGASGDVSKFLVHPGYEDREPASGNPTVRVASNVQSYPAYVEMDGTTDPAAGFLGLTTTKQSGKTTFAAFDLTEITNKVKVDLSAASSATVQTIRNAFKLQEFLEKLARGGSRYIEQNQLIFGQSSSDARLQRPELLGTHREPVVVSAIEQQSATANEPSPTGTLFGKLTSTQNLDTVRYHSEEHGILIQLQCVLPRTSYQQGLSRSFTHRETYLDYPWPQFAHIGEQEVYNSELYCGFDAPLAGETANSVTKTDLEGLFGYQPRYVDWKYSPDEVHGDFRGSLRFWHMSRIFKTKPTLSPEFIHSDPRYDVFAVTSDSVDHLYQEIWHDYKVVRALPEYGTPHF